MRQRYGPYIRISKETYQVIWKPTTHMYSQHKRRSHDDKVEHKEQQ